MQRGNRLTRHQRREGGQRRGRSTPPPRLPREGPSGLYERLTGPPDDLVALGPRSGSLAGCGPASKLDCHLEKDDLVVEDSTTKKARALRPGDIFYKPA